MNLLTVLLIVLLILALSGGWGYRAGWYAQQPYYGYGFGGVGLLLLVLIILVLFRLI